MFRKGLFKHNYCSFIHCSFKEMLTGVDQNWPKVPSLSGSFFPNKFLSQVPSSFYHRVHAIETLVPLLNHLRMLQVLVVNFCHSLASGLPRQNVFQPWSMSPPLISRVYPRYFTWGATLLPQPWPEHGFIVMRAYRLSCLHRQNCPTWLIAMART